VSVLVVGSLLFEKCLLRKKIIKPITTVLNPSSDSVGLFFNAKKMIHKFNARKMIGVTG
jgi:hypothetical protein